ncbi:MAG: hypothetical protein ACTS6J_24470, partial [Burkholderiales bacterium]
MAQRYKIDAAVHVTLPSAPPPRHLCGSASIFSRKFLEQNQSRAPARDWSKPLSASTGMQPRGPGDHAVHVENECLGSTAHQSSAPIPMAASVFAIETLPSISAC